MEMKDRAKALAVLLSNLSGITYEDVPNSKRYKTLSNSGVVLKNRGEPRWGNVHYHPTHIMIAIDYPQGAFSEEEFKNDLMIPQNKNQSESGFYITYAKNAGPNEYDSLRIKLYGSDAFNQSIVDRILNVVGKVYDIFIR
jgi:hypothetical protein